MIFCVVLNNLFAFVLFRFCFKIEWRERNWFLT
jgi:hypothetical protein